MTRYGRIRSANSVLSSALATALLTVACSATPAGPAWRAVVQVPAFAGATVHDVTSNGTGFVAVGDVISNGARQATTWTSPDGSS